MRHRQQWTIFQVLCVFLSIITLAQGAEDDAIYQVDFDQLFQSVNLNLQADSEGDVNRYSPWSYRPFCTDTLEEINSELCVYTSTTFAGGRGLSLFTTPSVADHVMATISSTRLNSGDSSSSGLDHYSSTSSGINADTGQGKWYTQPIPGKGTGMLAREALARGDLILSATPILIAYSENILPPAVREEYLRRAIDQLPSATRDMYLALASLSGHDDDDDDDDKNSNLENHRQTQVQDIAAANTFGITLFADQDDRGHAHAHLAVFPEPSRMNHDCAPNAHYHIDNRTLTQRVRAVRPVAAGEELSIAYTSPLDAWAERQSYLARSFGFRCACARCRRGPGPDSAALSEMASLHASLGDWSASSGASVAQAERLIGLYESEGLHGYMDPAYCHAALTYGSVGSARGVRKYVDLAVRAIELRLGPPGGVRHQHQDQDQDQDRSDVEVWKEMARAPERHWSWRRRKPRNQKQTNKY
ncbi:hypothetical protein RBB50_008181 [Rhinocladiella similis]